MASKFLVEQDLPRFIGDTGSAEVSMQESGKHIGLAKALDLEGKNLKHVNNNLSKKTGTVFLPRLYPPRKSASAIRSFPQGCGRKAHLASKEVAEEFVACKANGSNHRIPCVEDMSFEVTKNVNMHTKNSFLDFLPRVYPPQRKIYARRYFPEGCGRKAPNASMEVKEGQ